MLDYRSVEFLGPDDHKDFLMIVWLEGSLQFFFALWFLFPMYPDPFQITSHQGISSYFGGLGSRNLLPKEARIEFL